APRSAKNLGRSLASPQTTSTRGYRSVNSFAKVGLISTAICRPRPLRRCWITPVHAPVPAPSSTTTGSPLSGIATLSWVAIARELDVTAAIPRGLRRNSRRSMVSTTDHILSSNGTAVHAAFTRCFSATVARCLRYGARGAGTRWIGRVVKEVGGRYEEQRASHRRGEIQDPVVVSWRVPEEHVFQHLFGDVGSAGVADEVRAELAFAHRAEGHIVAQDLPLGAVGIGDRGQRDVGVVGFGGIVELDIGQLGTSDHLFLHVYWQGIPGSQVVQVLLHDHIASAGEVRILVANQDRGGGRRADVIFRPVNESEQITYIEVFKSMHLVVDRYRAVQSIHNLIGQFKARIHFCG